MTTKAAPPSAGALAQHLTRTYSFSTQSDTVEAMAMGKELFMAGATQANRELLEALEGARNEFIGLAAYLATCNTDVIVENLEATIAAIHRAEAKCQAAIAKAGQP